MRQHDRGVGWFRAGVNAALQASVMALPILVMVIWRSETHGGSTGDWFNWQAKLIWLKTALRDRWQNFDVLVGRGDGPGAGRGAAQPAADLLAQPRFLRAWS